MEYKVQIGKRIKELRKKKNLSQSFVAEKLFISQAAYSLIENSQNGIVADHIIKLSKLYEVTTDYILKGDKMLVRMSPSNGFIPLIKSDAQAAFLEDLENVKHLENVEWFRLPGFSPAQDQKMFEVEGESMVPTLLPGDVVICQKQKKIEHILDGTVVLIVTTKNILVKRLRLDSNSEFFLLESDNQENSEELKVKKSEIREAMIVRGKISSVLIPHHQIASKGKIQALEEAIEFLKKELYLITKKLNTMKN